MKWQFITFCIKHFPNKKEKRQMDLLVILIAMDAGIILAGSLLLALDMIYPDEGLL